MESRYDVIIVGGGPAGLSAALILGRCRRNVLVVDEGHPRNERATAMHGFLSRDGAEPGELARLGRAELLRYGVSVRVARATGAACEPGGFAVTLEDGTRLASRKLLLATGVRDVLPDVEGLAPLYGRSVHHCPYCDGWEHRDESLATLGAGDAAIGTALALRTWSASVTACTHGEAPSDESVERAERAGITIRTERVTRLEACDGRLCAVHFERGSPIPCTGLFFNTGQFQRSDLAERLGCSVKDNGGIATTKRQATDVPGLYVAGDADKDVQFVIVAAAEGATAGVAINREIQDEDLAREPRAPHASARA